MSFKKVIVPTEDRQKIYREMDQMFDSGMLTLGRYTDRFEESLSNILLDQKVIATSGGSSALEITCLALELSGFDVVIPSNTFIASAVSFIRNGANVIFADCDKHYGALTLESVKKAITPNTKAVVMVHIGGIISPEVIKIKEFCSDNDIYFIEDAAHALGSSFDNIPAGTFGDVGTFSFYPTKIITSGEGGAITTDSEKLHEKFKIFRDQGKRDFSSNIHTHFGSNWRLSEAHAIIGYHQVQRLNSFIQHRELIVTIYKDKLSDIPHIDILTPEIGKSNWYKMIIQLKDSINKDKLKKELLKNGVKCEGEVYQLPCHRQPIFNNLEINLPNTDYFTDHHLCLSISSDMNIEEAINQCNLINNTFKGVATL